MTVTAPGRCPRCHAPVLTGTTLRPGFDVVLDPEPLDPIGELDAILDGRTTCTLHVGAQQLATRGGRTIRARPAGTRAREQVLAQHRCQVST